MRYTMEELIPVVKTLAEKYTSFESTSITYEKAEQLMEAVLYCIRETEVYGSESDTMPAKPSASVPALALEPASASAPISAPASSGEVSAHRAYEAGLILVTEKVKKALMMYNEMMAEFCSYENRCLYDTVVKGLPEFFRWYDVKFAPQDTILTLDYPVMENLSGYTGIDRIYEYIRCIRREQDFLRRFPEEYVINVLRSYNCEYQEMTENIYEIVADHLT